MCQIYTFLYCSIFLPLDSPCQQKGQTRLWHHSVEVFLLNWNKETQTPRENWDRLLHLDNEAFTSEHPAVPAVSPFTHSVSSYFNVFFSIFHWQKSFMCIFVLLTHKLGFYLVMSKSIHPATNSSSGETTVRFNHIIIVLYSFIDSCIKTRLNMISGAHAFHMCISHGWTLSMCGPVNMTRYELYK